MSKKKKKKEFKIEILLKDSTVEEIQELLRTKNICYRIGNEMDFLPDVNRAKLRVVMQEINNENNAKLKKLYDQIMTEYMMGNSARIKSWKV